MAGHRSFIEEIKSRPSYIEHKAALKDGNNVKPNKVEKWSHAEHQKHVKESERVYSLVQMERHALHLHQKVTVRHDHLQFSANCPIDVSQPASAFR